MNGESELTSNKDPVICAEFRYEDATFQVVAFPKTEDDAFEWAVVRADVPYAWRDRASRLATDDRLIRDAMSIVSEVRRLPDRRDDKIVGLLSRAIERLTGITAPSS